MQINIFNRLNQYERILYKVSEMDSNIYESISKELKKQPEQIIIFQGNKIIERKQTYHHLQLDLEAQLSYYDGYEIDGKMKDQLKFKQQGSLDSFKTQSLQDITPTNQTQQSQVELFIKKKNHLQAKLDKVNQVLERIYIQESSPKLSDTTENLDSFKQIIPICYLCQNSIEGREFQTPCFHNFHYECLELLINSQIYGKKPNFQCSCNKNIQLNSLFQIVKDYQTAQNMKQGFFKNQLLQIQEKLKEGNSLMLCSNNCGCFYIKNSNSKIQQKCFCFYCEVQTPFIQ